MTHMILSALLIVGLLGLTPRAWADPLSVADVVASSAQQGNGPANTIDGDLNTRWSAQGAGETITYSLSECATVTGLQIAWYQGNSRVATFEVEVSEDGETYTLVHSGDSSGNTLELQAVDVADTHACFVRIVGYGNSVNSWNSITEVVIEGTIPEPEPLMVPVPLSALEQLCAPLLNP